MSKKLASAPDEVIEIPVTFGGKGRIADHRDRVGIMVDRGTHRLSLSLRAENHPHVADWRYCGATFLSNGTGEITGVKLTKAGRGFSVRRSSDRRPKFIIALMDVTVTPVVDHGGDDDNDVVSTIEGEAVVFTLPRVIKGKYQSFKLSRS
jgi:hypothetical protein